MEQINLFLGTKAIYDITPIDFKKYIEYIEFKNREIWMMYNKALLFAKDKYEQNNLEVANKILQETNPKKVKDLGRKVTGFDEKIWNLWKYKIVVNGNYLQFSQDNQMKQILLDTGDKDLVEASPFDAIWGIGYDSKQALKVKQNQWGENLLGKALIEIRTIINNEKQ